MALGGILTGFVTILIATNLVGPVASTIAGVKNDGNLTSSDKTLLGLVTLFFILGVMIAGVQTAVAGLAEIGLI